MLEIVASMWLLHEKELLVGERRTSMEERRKNLSSRKLLIKYWRPKIGDKFSKFSGFSSYLWKKVDGHTTRLPRPAENKGMLHKII